MFIYPAVWIYVQIGCVCIWGFTSSAIKRSPVSPLNPLLHSPFDTGFLPVTVCVIVPKG